MICHADPQQAAYAAGCLQHCADDKEARDEIVHLDAVDILLQVFPEQDLILQQRILGALSSLCLCGNVKSNFWILYLIVIAGAVSDLRIRGGIELLVEILSKDDTEELHGLALLTLARCVQTGIDCCLLLHM